MAEGDSGEGGGWFSNLFGANMTQAQRDQMRNYMMAQVLMRGSQPSTAPQASALGGLNTALSPIANMLVMNSLMGGGSKPTTTPMPLKTGAPPQGTAALMNAGPPAWPGPFGPTFTSPGGVPRPILTPTSTGGPQYGPPVPRNLGVPGGVTPGTVGSSGAGAMSMPPNWGGNIGAMAMPPSWGAPPPVYAPGGSNPTPLTFQNF